MKFWHSLCHTGCRTPQSTFSPTEKKEWDREPDAAASLPPRECCNPPVQTVKGG